MTRKISFEQFFHFAEILAKNMFQCSPRKVFNEKESKSCDTVPKNVDPGLMIICFDYKQGKGQLNGRK